MRWSGSRLVFDLTSWLPKAINFFRMSSSDGGVGGFSGSSYMSKHGCGTGPRSSAYVCLFLLWPWGHGNAECAQAIWMGVEEGKRGFWWSLVFSLETSPTQVVACIHGCLRLWRLSTDLFQNSLSESFRGTPWRCASARESFPVACIHFQSHPSPATGPSSLSDRQVGEKRCRQAGRVWPGGHISRLLPLFFSSCLLLVKYSTAVLHFLLALPRGP